MSTVRCTDHAEAKRFENYLSALALSITSDGAGNARQIDQTEVNDAEITIWELPIKRDAVREDVWNQSGEREPMSADRAEELFRAFRAEEAELRQWRSELVL